MLAGFFLLFWRNFAKVFYSTVSSFFWYGKMKTMKKFETCCFVGLLLLTGGLLSIPSVFSQTENIKIVSYSYYIDAIGVLDVVGEVQNVGSNTVDFVYLTGTAYSADGTDQGSSSCRVWVSYLTPQQRAPFYMEFYTPSSSSSDWASVGVSQVTLAVSQADATSSYQYQDLEITSSSATVSTDVDDLGTYWVSGTIQNTGSQTASQLTVVGVFYNSSGTAVGVGYTNYLTPTSLNPSETTSFKIGAFDLNQSIVPSSQKISSYYVLVQTQSPILEGEAPIASSSPSGSTSPTSTEQGDDTSGDSSNLNLIYAIVIAVVVVVIIGVLLALRKRKPPTIEVKAKREPSKSRKRRMVEFSPLPFYCNPKL